jgi:hypothetical protein
VDVQEPARGDRPGVRVLKDEAVVERAVAGLLDPHPRRGARRQYTISLRYENDLPAVVANGLAGRPIRDRSLSLAHGSPPAADPAPAVVTTVSNVAGNITGRQVRPQGWYRHNLRAPLYLLPRRVIHLLYFGIGELDP